MTVNPTLFRGITGGGDGGGGEVAESVLKTLSKFLQEIKSSSDSTEVAGLTTLRQNIETLEKRGHITEGDIEALKNELATLAESPKLDAPSQAEINNFITELNQIPTGTFPLTGSGGNAFLDCSAILELFKMTAKITVALAQIQYKEALARIKAMELQKESAIEASILTKEGGVIAAEKDLIQARTAYAQAGMALSGALSGAICAIGGWVAARVEYNKVISGPPLGNDAQKMQRAMDAATQAERQWTLIGQSSEKVSDAAQKFAEAIKFQQLSSKEIQEATLKAAADLLRTLGDLQSQTASTLAQSVSGLETEIKAFLDRFIDAMKGWTRAWDKG